MRSTNKNKGLTGKSGKSTGASSKKIGDAESKRLQKLSQKIGNENLNNELKKNTVERDRILAFICERLKTVHQVQLKELAEKDNVREWYKEVAMGKKGHALPDPTRWHECAELFKRAAISISNGQLGKGAQLLEEAMKKQESAYDALPDQVERKLDGKEKKSRQNEHMSVTSGSICPSTSVPKGIEIANKILNIIDEPEKNPPLPLPWWELKPEIEEDEDEEEDGEE